MKLEKIKEVLFMRVYVRMPNKHHAYHYGHNFAHCTYLGAVFKEAHGFYGYAAGVLLIIVIVGFFIGEEA